MACTKTQKKKKNLLIITLITFRFIIIIIIIILYSSLFQIGRMLSALLLLGLELHLIFWTTVGQPELQHEWTPSQINNSLVSHKILNHNFVNLSNYELWE